MFLIQIFQWLLLHQLSAHQHSTIDYVAKVIHSIEKTHAGFFTCWLYNLQDADSDFISALLQIPSFQTVPKLIMTSMNMSVVNPFKHNPSLLVIRCKTCSSTLSWKHLTLYRVSVETKILVVHECKSYAQFDELYFVFGHLKLANAVFLDLNTNAMSYVLFYERRLVKLDSFKVLPSELFVNQVRDLHGYYVTAVIQHANPETTMFSKHGILGRDFMWIGDTARHLNGSAGFGKIDCDEESLSLKECEFRKKYRKNKQPHDIILDPAFDTRIKAYFIDSVEPDRRVIMVPCGQKLTPLEMFLFVPFNLHVWLCLIVLTVVCWVLVLNYSTVFINDPILAVLSGIERRGFHQTGKPEKLLITVLTILFFILLQAYETKIIALMTSYPYKSDPHDLEDLRLLGIKTRYVEGGCKYFANSQELENLIETVPAFGGMSEMFQYASIGEENLVNLLATMPNYFYDRDYRPRFVILKDYNLGLAIRQFWMSQRNLLARVFKKTQRIFFEAGIRQLKMDHVMHIHRMRSQLITNAESKLESGSDILDFVEMAPAWYVALIGWMFSIIVCFGEISAGYLNKLKFIFNREH